MLNPWLLLGFRAFSLESRPKASLHLAKRFLDMTLSFLTLPQADILPVRALRARSHSIIPRPARRVGDRSHRCSRKAATRLFACIDATGVIVRCA
jgi:hypothetical protein